MTIWGPVELRRYLHLFRRRWLVLLACIIVGAAVGWATAAGSNSYVAGSEIYVGTRSLQQDQNQLYAEPGLNQVVATYAAMIPSESFAAQALNGSGIVRSPASVAAETKAVVVTNTTLIDVTVTDSNPVMAQRLANVLGNAFARLTTTGPGGTPPLPGSLPGETAYVFQYAGPGGLISHHTSRHVALGAVFGLIIGILVVLLVDYLDTTVRGTETIERRLGLPVLAVVPLTRQVTSLRPRPARTRVTTWGGDDV
jgi:capsular polysaccharide biosynthesis protein